VFWNEFNDMVLNLYLPVLKQLYKHNSGKKVLPGQHNFMSLEEFLSMWRNADLVNDNLTAPDIHQSYSFSIMVLYFNIDLSR
jgi:hypothetical protein